MQPYRFRGNDHEVARSGLTAVPAGSVRAGGTNCPLYRGNLKVITAIAALVLTTGGVFVLQSVKASDRQHEMQDQRQCFLDNYGNPAAIRDKC